MRERFEQNIRVLSVFAGTPAGFVAPFILSIHFLHPLGLNDLH